MLQDAKFIFDFIENVPIGITSADISGKLPSQFNKYFLEMFGWESQQIDTLDKWFSKACPDKRYRDYIVGAWNKAIEETKSNGLHYSKTIEVKIACKDGTYKWCEARCYRQDNYVYGIFVDISKSKKINELLHNLTVIDDLTKTKNRRAYHEKIEELLALYKRYDSTFSMIIFDIDNFKKINDTYGHQAGDSVLIDLCNLIQSHIRQNDYLFRVGGEEFVLLLQNTDLENGKSVANNLLKLIENDLNTIENKTITVSMGLSEVNKDDTEDSIYKRVDRLLYKSKENGKNRVTYL